MVEYTVLVTFITRFQNTLQRSVREERAQKDLRPENKGKLGESFESLAECKILLL